MLPTRRDFRFRLPPSRVRNWHARGAHVSHFFNALSVFFPVGERFFIASVRNYRERVDDVELSAEIRAFIGQEAMHGREHEDYNRLLADAGMPAEALERAVARALALLQDYAPKSWQLSSTIALEHFTAVLADRLLADAAMLDGSQSQYRKLWLWHAIEETEHKAVAYDVWDQVMGQGVRAYALRSGGMVLTGAAFVALVAAFTAVMLANDPSLAGKRGGLAELSRFLVGRGGLIRSGLPAWLDYFRPSFHPWQHDNRDLLQRLNEVDPQPMPKAATATPRGKRATPQKPQPKRMAQAA